ncbi:2,3-dimethylmalate lyase [Bordetella holmesii 35009]|nr:2,3-dimethylmalate lyase [Bordetella holmesii 35009]
MTSSALKSRLRTGQALLAPGVYDALSALIAEQTGFDALYLSGASIAYSRLGRSDVGLTTYSEVESVLGRITERVRCPVIVDADTGFGNALNVQRTVRGLERAGAAMIQLEDQDFPSVAAIWRESRSSRLTRCAASCAPRSTPGRTTIR